MQVKNRSPGPKKHDRLTAPINPPSFFCYICCLDLIFIGCVSTGRGEKEFCKKESRWQELEKASLLWIEQGNACWPLWFTQQICRTRVILNQSFISAAAGNWRFRCGDRSPRCAWPSELSVSRAGGGSAPEGRKQEAAPCSKQNRWLDLHLSF